MKFSFSPAVKSSDGTEGPVSSRLRHLPGRYLSTSQLPIATPPSPPNIRFAIYFYILTEMGGTHIFVYHLLRRNSSGPKKHLRRSLPLLQSNTGVEKKHAKTPYERRSPGLSVPTPRSALHQPPTPAATPGSPAVLTPTTTVTSSSPGTSGVTPPVRQRKRRNNESVEAGPSSSAGGSTTPSTNRIRSNQPTSNGSKSSLHHSPTKKARLQTGKEAFHQAISPPAQQLHSRANIGAGTLQSHFVLFSLSSFFFVCTNEQSYKVIEPKHCSLIQRTLKKGRYLSISCQIAFLLPYCH